jgi:hypothetical protein
VTLRNGGNKKNDVDDGNSIGMKTKRSRKVVGVTKQKGTRRRPPLQIIDLMLKPTTTTAAISSSPTRTTATNDTYNNDDTSNRERMKEKTEK